MRVQSLAILTSLNLIQASVHIRSAGLPSFSGVPKPSTRRVDAIAASMPVAPAAAIMLRGGAGTLPGLPALAAASFLPTCLGLWKNGYAVSYGYGGAMLATGALMLRSSPGLSALAKAHALALVFYGLRLNTFLLYRELALPEEVHQMKRRDASLIDRLKRLPIIIGCSALYYCMGAPLRVTAMASGSASGAAAVAVALSFMGFGIAALGDLVKTVVKAKEGPDFLVTSGPFRWLRHPNYTGELVGWSASAVAAVLAAVGEGSAFALGGAKWWLLGSALGWLGILFVLAGEATAGLEKKQRDKYGGSAEYEAWVARSWAGPMMPA